jgi:hypothetical protein
MNDPTQAAAVSTRFDTLHATLVGVIATLAVYATTKTVGTIGHRDSLIPIAVGVYALAGVVIGWRLAPGTAASMWRRGLARVAAAYGGIALGVILWVILEEVVFRRLSIDQLYEDHNLFPFEIVMLWIVGALPWLAGGCVGVVARRGIHRRRS